MLSHHQSTPSTPPVHTFHTCRPSSRLIDQVANQIWVCEDGKVEVWKGDIRSYKKKLAKKMGITMH